MLCLPILLAATPIQGLPSVPDHFGPPAYFVFLVRGDNPPKAAKEEIEGYQRAHIDNFKRLYGLKRIITAGPMQDPTGFKRGIIVFTLKNEKEVIESFGADPYVQKGFMVVQALPIRPEFGKFNSTDIDPEGIVENRIAIFTINRDSTVKPDWKAHQAYIAHPDPSTEAAFAGTFTKSKELSGVVFFRGKNEGPMRAWLDADPLVKSGYLKCDLMPQWLSKGIL